MEASFYLNVVTDILGIGRYLSVRNRTRNLACPVRVVVARARRWGTEAASPTTSSRCQNISQPFIYTIPLHPNNTIVQIKSLYLCAFAICSVRRAIKILGFV
jgi:hypothetical protein